MENQVSSFPKAFWKYYDLYRRKQISLLDFSKLSGLSEYMLQLYLKAL